MKNNTMIAEHVSNGSGKRKAKRKRLAWLIGRLVVRAHRRARTTTSPSQRSDDAAGKH